MMATTPEKVLATLAKEGTTTVGPKYMWRQKVIKERD